MLRAQRGGISMGIRKRVPFGKMIPRKLCLRSERPAGCCWWGYLSSEQRGGALPQDMQFCTSGGGWSADWLPPHRPLSGNLWDAHNSNPGTPDGWQCHAHWPRRAQEYTEHTLPWTASARAAGKQVDTPYRVAFCLLLAPFQQSIALRAAVLPGQRSQRVSSFHTG